MYDTCQILRGSIYDALGEEIEVSDTSIGLCIETRYVLSTGAPLTLYAHVRGEMVVIEDDGTIISSAICTTKENEHAQTERILRHIHRVWGTYATSRSVLRVGPIYPEDAGDAVSRLTAAALSIDQLLIR